MNSLYTLALRQTASLQGEIDSLEKAYATNAAQASIAQLNGQINASFAAFDRTITDYDDMARREMVESRREKALQRVGKFKNEYGALRNKYSEIKGGGSVATAHVQRSQLVGSSSSFTSPYLQHSTTNRNPSLSVPKNDFTIDIGGGSDFQNSVHNNQRTKYALRENDFISQTSATLDTYLAQGQAVLGNLGNQRDMLKNTQRRILSAANTLGLSRNTIQYIERRTTGDYYVVILGGLFTLVCFYFILKYFG